MGKRSTFIRRKNDSYATWDPRAVAALLPHLAPMTRFAEPCAGTFDLVRMLVEAGHLCTWVSDIGHRDGIDAMTLNQDVPGDLFITNPPWTRDILHRLIAHLSAIKPTWLLFDADWAHTVQAEPYMPLCRKIVSVGRLRWIEGSVNDGKDNCAWYLFATPHKGDAIGAYSAFFPRRVKLSQTTIRSLEAESAA